MKIYSLLIIVIIVLIGIFFMGCKCKTVKEGFENYNCPNILIQKGSVYHLYNSKRAKVPGVNPIQFNTLEDYVDFIKWQRSQGIRCPVLYLQQIYDTQGNEKYIVKTDSEFNTVPPEFRGAPTLPPQSLLLDAGRTDPPYNQDHYASFDPMGQYIGANTPLDKMFHESYGGVSPNPMDTNWGGDNYTQRLIDRGFYKNREVSFYSPLATNPSFAPQMRNAVYATNTQQPSQPAISPAAATVAATPVKQSTSAKPATSATPSTPATPTPATPAKPGKSKAKPGKSKAKPTTTTTATATVK